MQPDWVLRKIPDIAAVIVGRPEAQNDEFLLLDSVHLSNIRGTFTPQWGDRIGQRQMAAAR
jgi:hypothetical protein